MAEALPRKPREYLEEMEIGYDLGIKVPPEYVNRFKTAASSMKMYGKKFKTKVVEGGLNVWRVK